MALPAAAAADTYVVNETGPVDVPEVGCESVSPERECSLWEAIELSNENAGEDTIEFEVEEVEVNDEPLPSITDAVTIDGKGPGGAPGVDIFRESEGFLDGLVVETSGATIEGLAIGYFGSAFAIYVDGSDNQICANYIGTDLAGGEKNTNEVGVYVTSASSGTEIGAGCADGNVISGNEWFGVLDEGESTSIQGNRIGTDAGGTVPISNGAIPLEGEPGGGILAGGSDTSIGGLGAGQGNTIAFNLAGEFPGAFGGGVVVGQPGISIRANSIFSNQGAGIYYYLEGSPPIPTLEAVESTAGVSTVVSGSLEGEIEEEFSLDFFVNGECDPSGSGEGRVFLNFVEVETNGAGVVDFEATLPVLSQGQWITATATEAAIGSSSEFSECIETPEPEEGEGEEEEEEEGEGEEEEGEGEEGEGEEAGEEAAGSSGATPPSGAPAPKGGPVNGESVAVAPKQGVVFVKRPGGKRKKLKAGETIPVGSLVDARHGKVTLTSIDAAGHEQTAVFYGGVFLVQQHEGSGLVILKLRGGNFRSCGRRHKRHPKRGAASSRRKSKRGRAGRRLWGSGKGNFRTEGNNGSASVRGTIWLTEDRCDGTFFKVRRGVVTIRDFGAHRTFSLPKGKSYLAKP